MMINTYSKIVSIIDLLSRVKPIIATAILISVICFSITPIKAQTAGDEITSLTWNSLSTELAIAGRFSGDYGIQIRDNSGQVLISLPTRNRPLSVSWSNDDQYIASVFRQDNQHMIQIWERSGFPFNSILEQGAKTNYSVQWFPGSNTSMLATEASGLLNLWNFETGNREDVIAHQGSMNISIFDWIWNDDGTEIFTISNNSIISAWDIGDNSILREIPVERPTSLSLSPNGNMLGIASWNDNIIILDASNFSSQQILQRISSPTSQLMAVRWSPDSSQIVASSFDEITVWDVFTGNIINTIPTSQSIVETDPQAIDYSSSGQLTYINQDASIVIAPITNAGVDQSIMDADNNGSELVNLDASLSSDSDGTIVSYEWTENGISIATGINPQVNFGVGVHQIVLTVTDDDGATGADVVAITIEANTPTCDSTISASDTTPNSSQR